MRGDARLTFSLANIKRLAAKGLTLSNYFGVTHPSEPNYCAIYGGDNFGMDNDNFHQIPANVSNIWDLLAAKGISFASYQENLPYTGFQGFQFLNQGNGADNYVRKHNPPVLFNGNVDKPERVNAIKDFVAFQQDLANNELPQHIFITPNELNDAHDTQITYGADWLFPFVSALLDDPHFMNDTLLIINFDENGTDGVFENRVFTIILSDILPDNLVGATDTTVYTHYSALATVEANWDLDTLGRWDVPANVFSYVAELTGDTVRHPQLPVGHFFLNASYPGSFALTDFGPLAVPNVTMEVNGRKVFSEVVEQWGGIQECTYYDDTWVVPADGINLPKAIPASCSTLTPSPLPTSSASITSSSQTTFATSTTTHAPLVCNEDNCLRELQDNRFSSEASIFCATYTLSVNTAPSAIPTYLENCAGIVSAVSSGCSCLMAPTAKA
jgi:acid phosphatase